MSIYGRTATAFAEDLGCSLQVAEDLLKAYFKGFNGLKRWLEITGEVALITRWVKSASGRMLMCGEDNAKGIGGANTLRRRAANMIIQSSGADMCKLALPMIDSTLKKLDMKYYPILKGRESRIINAVHDN